MSLDDYFAGRITGQEFDRQTSAQAVRALADDEHFRLLATLCAHALEADDRRTLMYAALVLLSVTPDDKAAFIDMLARFAPAVRPAAAPAAAPRRRRSYRGPNVLRFPSSAADPHPRRNIGKPVIDLTGGGEPA